jgi:tyrosine phenol-lyase
MERGVLSASRDPKTGEHRYPRLELVRLTIPRRVYTQAHMDVTAEAIEEVWWKRDKVTRLRLVYESKYLRFFQAGLERLCAVRSYSILKQLFILRSKTE